MKQFPGLVRQSRFSFNERHKWTPVRHCCYAATCCVCSCVMFPRLHRHPPVKSLLAVRFTPWPRPGFSTRKNYWSRITSSTFLQDSLKCIKSISAMCPSEMRNPAPAWIKGLGTEYLGGGISAVSAQRTELQLHKSWGMNAIMNALRFTAAHVHLRYHMQLLIIEIEISPHLIQRQHWNVGLHTTRGLKRWQADHLSLWQEAQMEK